MAQGRRDPKNPASDPGWEKAVAVGKSRVKDLKFKSEGDRKDYERAVSRNPNNVMGLPPFYPPEQIKMFMSSMPQKSKEQIAAERKKREWFMIRELASNHTELFCESCKKVTEWGIVQPEYYSGMYSWCTKCGRQGPFHM